MTRPVLIDPDHELYTTYRAPLVRFATPILGSVEWAEDVVQDVFLRLAARRLTPNEGWKSYLYAMVRNHAIDALRRRALEQRVQSSEPPFWGIPAAQASGEDLLVGQQQLAQLRSALAELPDLERQAIELHRFSRLSFEQIGQRLGVSTATAHRYVRAGVVKLTLALNRSRGAADE